MCFLSSSGVPLYVLPQLCRGVLTIRVNFLLLQVEEHMVDGKPRTLLVHRKVRPCDARTAPSAAPLPATMRKSPSPDQLLPSFLQGATRAFPPHHPLIPVDYQFTGQPVLIGGTMVRCATREWNLRHAKSNASFWAGSADARLTLFCVPLVCPSPSYFFRGRAATC